ncbi:MAG: methylmalonyl-CoA mutase family protein, partial [Pseudomonadota bacterium]
VNAIEYMKSRLVEANAQRIQGIEGGDTTVVGVNKYQAGEPSPLTAGDDAIMVVDPAVEADQIERLNAWKAERDEGEVRAAIADLRAAARDGTNIMPASIRAARVGVTTGEWGDVVRQAFGQYRGPTGVSSNPSNRTEGLEEIRDAVATASSQLGRKLKFMMGKPGLDGHSNGAEQIAARARDCGMDIAYEGIRLTPAEIVEAARAETPHVIGLSILSGSHVPLVEDLMARFRREGLSIPVVVGGIIPDDDAERLRAMGVAKVYTPKDFELNRIMFDIVALAQPEPVAAE